MYAILQFTVLTKEESAKLAVYVQEVADLKIQKRINGAEFELLEGYCQRASLSRSDFKMLEKELRMRTKNIVKQYVV